MSMSLLSYGAVVPEGWIRMAEKMAATLPDRWPPLNPGDLYLLTDEAGNVFVTEDARYISAP